MEQARETRYGRAKHADKDSTYESKTNHHSSPPRSFVPRKLSSSASTAHLQSPRREIAPADFYRPTQSIHKTRITADAFSPRRTRADPNEPEPIDAHTVHGTGYHRSHGCLLLADKNDWSAIHLLDPSMAWPSDRAAGIMNPTTSTLTAAERVKPFRSLAPGPEYLLPYAYDSTAHSTHNLYPYEKSPLVRDTSFFHRECPEKEWQEQCFRRANLRMAPDKYSMPHVPSMAHLHGPTQAPSLARLLQHSPSKAGTAASMYSGSPRRASTISQSSQQSGRTGTSLSSMLAGAGAAAAAARRGSNSSSGYVVRDSPTTGWHGEKASRAETNRSRCDSVQSSLSDEYDSGRGSR